MMEKSLSELDAYRAQRCHDIEENYKQILDNIARAEAQRGVENGSTKFMAVTKTVEPYFINHALSLGIDLIGENRVQELMGKKPELNLEGVDVHLIGHLQTNKVKQVVGEVSTIQSVDSVKVAKEISKVSLERGITTNVLVEVNIGDEESKSGLETSKLVETCHEIAELPNIQVEGLMAIPPICDSSAEVRQFFAQMYKLFIDIYSKNIDNINMHILSMGMSSDYEDAILEGANLIRVGSSLFGARIY